MGRFWMKISVLLAVVLLSETETTTNLKWVKASNGQVPEYAVAKGSNSKGEVLYVARISLPSGLTPGNMDASSKKAHASLRGKVQHETSYEILTNPGWRSYLKWQKVSVGDIPYKVVLGGTENGNPLYVAGLMNSDGHMIPGTASSTHRKAYVVDGGKEYENEDVWLLVEHEGSGRKRGFSSRFEYPDLPGVEPLKRAPILDQ